ncbi:DUF3772 domain-containing protein [Henriciella litoralis]|uniref:DUF3772 domain-containing protein n=1 Tax=Henriciella litoralis TaxID=568102 RepID=UPI0009FE9743|nr:DUF3772 domain-containing protein [Henriciella litoralis]
MSSFSGFLRLIALMAVLFVCAAQGLAQTSPSSQTLDEIDQIEKQLETITSEISAISSEYSAEQTTEELNKQIVRVNSLRSELSNIEQSATLIRLNAQEALQSVSDLEAPETTPSSSGSSAGKPTSGEQDEKLASELAGTSLAGVTAPTREIFERATVAVASARLAGLDASRLSSKISSVRDNLFVSDILDRGPIPVLPSVWATAISRVDDVAGELASEGAEWRAERTAAGTPYPFVILAVVSLVLLVGLMRLYARLYKLEVKRFTDRKPSRQTVATVAMTSFLTRFIAAAAAVLIVAGVARLIGLNVLESAIGRSIAMLAVVVFCMRALAASVVAPRTASFRLIGIGDEAAQAVSLSFIIMVLAFSLESVIASTGALASPGPELVAIRTFVLVLLTSGLLIWLAVKLKAQTENGRSTVRVVIRQLIVAVAIFILAASLLGYQSLARYVVERIVLVSIVLLIAILVREFVRAGALRILSGVEERRRYASARDEDDTDAAYPAPQMNSQYWIKLSVDLVVLMVLPPFLLLALGMQSQELWDEIRWLMTGIEIGGQRISLGKVFAAILSVIAVLVASRLIQRTFERSILPKTQISSGAANSLVTLLGYAGVLIAGLTAIGVVGFDLSSLAIIAGALSVGIGFGLQSIVSNFVAGLILLFERPFKIGDWIVTPSGEGTVQKINVRATEVLTFDRRSIIVPNAELISNAFGNWTHKSAMMRVAVEIGVKYGTDTRRVETLLLDIANGMDNVLNDPAPQVVMKNFGDSSLDFELRIFLQADNVVLAPSNIRHEIAKVFAREGIEIPFPQRDINFEWPEGLRTRGSGGEQKEADAKASPRPKQTGSVLDKNDDDLPDSDSDADN